MAGLARKTSGELEKEALEIKKLRNDILISRLTLLAQIANTATIAILGILVLIYVQRPTLLASEQQHVDNLFMSALKLPPAERKPALDALIIRYPRYDYISVYRGGLDVVRQEPAALPSTCPDLSDLWLKTRVLLFDLQASVLQEEMFGSGVRRSGRGAVYRALRAQQHDAEDQLAKIKQDLKRNGCSFVDPLEIP
jgi:hypothetical protein